MSSKRPLKATDKRRQTRAHGLHAPEGGDDNGSGDPLGNLFNDRRKNLGHGKRAS